VSLLPPSFTSFATSILAGVVGPSVEPNSSVAVGKSISLDSSASAVVISTVGICVLLDDSLVVVSVGIISKLDPSSVVTSSVGITSKLESSSVVDGSKSVVVSTGESDSVGNGDTEGNGEAVCLFLIWLFVEKITSPKVQALKAVDFGRSRTI